MGLAEAREKAGALRVRVRGGEDPVAERRRLRALGATPRVFALHLGRSLAALGAAELQMTADAYPAHQSAAAAIRYVRPVQKWGAARGHLQGAAAAAVEPPATVKRRERVLARKALEALLPALSARDADPYRRALLVMLLTLARRKEVAAARWRDLDLEAAEWRIAETKNGSGHRVPLSRQAVELLRAAGPEAPEVLVFRTPALRGGNGRLVDWDRETKRLMEVTGTAGWTRHDLRRTGATQLGEIGVEPHVIEAAPNHAAIHSRLAATYNRARYLPAVRNALQALADLLDAARVGGAEVARPANRRT